jgi:adenosine kinase
MAAANNVGAVLGAGNPLLDISADVPEEMLAKYDVKLNNAILCEEKHLPVYKDLVDNYKVQYIAGGATQNSIRVCQWMLQEEGATSFIGCVGKDAFGEQLRKSASADGVSVHYMEDAETATGTCAVLVNSSERSLIANLAAANKYQIDHLQSAVITKVWEKARFYYIAGFFLTVSPPSIMHLAKHSLEQKKTFAMNLSAPFISQFFKEPLLAAMPYIDILFGNESEADAFGAAMGYEDKSPKAVATAIAALPKEGDKKRIAVITQGAGNTIVVVDGALTEYPVPKLDAKEIVDVNGAGDAFVGGFISQFINGRDIATCVKAGHYAAGVILRVSGTALSGKPEFVAE